MEELKLAERYKNILRDISEGLKDIYREELIALVVYGSAASGEFREKQSNLNLLVVLKNTDLGAIKRSSKLMRKHRMINPLFMTREFIFASSDIFPIEFLDMQENYFLLFGKDVVKEIRVELRNLRFQCEHELKAKLLRLKQAYLALNGDAAALKELMFSSFKSILHISRNILRLKGKKPPYLKEEIIKELASQLGINTQVWERILAARNKQIKLSKSEVEPLFANFVQELESVVAIVDKL